MWQSPKRSLFKRSYNGSDNPHIRPEASKLGVAWMDNYPRCKTCRTSPPSLTGRHISTYPWKNISSVLNFNWSRDSDTWVPFALSWSCLPFLIYVQWPTKLQVNIFCPLQMRLRRVCSLLLEESNRLLLWWASALFVRMESNINKSKI